MAIKAERKKHGFFSSDGHIDITFLSFVLILLTVGLVMLFSASYAYSLEYYGTSYKFISRQLLFAVGGVVVMLIVSKINYHFWKKVAWLLFGISIILLVVLLIFPPMVSGMEVKRWFAVGGLSFQPSEVAKFALILVLSSLISSKYKLMNDFKFVAFLVIVLGATCVLIVLEPHFSATVLVFLIGITLMIIGGLGVKYIITGGLLTVAGVAVAVFSGILGYGSDRIKYWRDPWLAPKKEGFQTIQSLLAIGSGGIMGRGIGQSRQKYLWVPEPHNDFIFSIVCEELGLIGAVIIIILFALLVWRGFKIGIHAQDKFGSLLAIGLTFQVGLQAMLNIWVVTNTIPNTGISLPFFSYGGTSLMLLLFEMGIVMSVSRSTSLEKT